MTMTFLKFSLVSSIVVTSVATPLVIQLRAQAKLNAKQESLHRQTTKIAQLIEENDRLSNLRAQAKSPKSLSDEQLKELLRLRNEVGQLRTQTNVIQNLRAENRQLYAGVVAAQNQETQMSPAERGEALSSEIIEAMKNICRELRPAMQRFANDHTNQLPTDFPELRNYFPTSGGKRMTGLYTFGFVRDSGPMPGDAIILSENGTHRKEDGTIARVYAFSDGRVVEVTSDDEGHFEAWEKEHMASPPSPNP